MSELFVVEFFFFFFGRLVFGGLGSGEVEGWGRGERREVEKERV